MWIAFKNYYLRDEEQHNEKYTNIRNRCELLSKIIIFVTRNNFGDFLLCIKVVVNCFQKLLSSWRGTTYFLMNPQYQCCELLSKIIIFVTRNNMHEWQLQHHRVVNCFQKLLSSWRGTTSSANVYQTAKLWIAFKNYYLRDEEQQIQN